MKRVKDFKVREVFEIQASNLANRRSEQNGWVKVMMVDDQGGEYIVTLKEDGTRVTLDGYENAR